VIPAYFYPSPTLLWDSATAAGGGVSFMVANPNNGPGSALNGDYAIAIARAQAAGVRVMGYVYTSYGARSAAAVKADVATWKQFYGVTDIFFDEASDVSSKLAYYQDIVNTVHATSGAEAMLNPGVNVDSGYGDVADIINIFEGTPSAYTQFQPAAWTANYPASKFANLIYGASTSSLTSVLAQSVTRRAGYVYITNDTLPNPWDTLPSYWTTEVAQVNQACAGATSG
jgi:hypothetical protein